MEEKILETEMDKAMEAGFEAQFLFIFDGLCSLVYAGIEYDLKDVIKRSCPCLINQHTVYLIVTESGIRGVAVIDWADFVFDD